MPRFKRWSSFFLHLGRARLDKRQERRKSAINSLLWQLTALSDNMPGLKLLFSNWFTVALLSALALGHATRGAQLGLSVGADGALMKDGKVYRGIGVNYFDLFSRPLARPEDSSSLSNLAVLARAEVPFVRFMCGGYWPAEQHMFLTNRTVFFERLDQVVRSAETNKIGLIPSLFWYFATVPDLMGESIDQLGNPNSAAINHIREFTSAIISRYRNSPAIWGWEFGNEYNLECDLPNHASHRPAIQPVLGTPTTRTERDELEFRQLKVALRVFAQTARKLDPTRVIFTGNAAPRASAWHNVTENSWLPDSRAQFGEILLRDNPDPFDSITIHVYHESTGSYPGGAKTIDEFVGVANALARWSRKPLFLGEFGVPANLGAREKQEAALREFLTAIRRHEVPLSAYWVFDFPPQTKNYSIDPAGDRMFILEAIREVNRSLSNGGE